MTIINPTLETQTLDEIIQSYRFKTKVDHVTLSIEKSKNIINVPLKIVDGVYRLELNSHVLEKYPAISFIDEATAKQIASISYAQGECFIQATESLDILCNISVERLEVNALKAVTFSGYICSKQNAVINCDSCNLIEDTGNTTSIEVKSFVIRAQNKFFLQKGIQLKVNEGLYCSANDMENHGVLILDHMNFAMDRLSNFGSLIVSRYVVGFVKSFVNHVSGHIEVGEYFGFPAEDYFDEGVTKTAILDVQSRSADIQGHLYVSQKASFFSEEKLHFGVNAIIDVQNIFQAECDRSIQFLGHLQHHMSEPDSIIQDLTIAEGRGQIQFTAKDEFIMAGSVHVQHANVQFTAGNFVNITKLMSGDSHSNLSITAERVNLDEILSGFRFIQVHTKFVLDVIQSIFALESVMFSAKQINIKATIESKNALQLKAEHIHINGSGEVLVSQASQIICDTLRNEGTICCQNLLRCGVNYTAINFGRIIASTLQISSGCYMNLGLVCVEHNMQVNALLSFSVGLTSSRSYQGNALIDVGTGVHLGSLPELNDIFSTNTVSIVMRVIAQKLAPKVTQSYDLTLQTYRWLSPILSQSTSMTDFFNILQLSISDYYNKNLKINLRDIALYEFIDYLATYKELTFTLKGHAQQLSTLADFKQNVTSVLDELQQIVDLKEIQTKLSSVTAMPIVDMLMPKHGVDTLLNMNSGMTVTTKSFIRSHTLYHAGVHTALTSLSVSTVGVMNNAGIIGSAGDIHLSGQALSDSGITINGGRVNAGFDKVDIKSSYANWVQTHWHIKSNQCLIASARHFTESSIQSEQVTVSGSAISKSNIAADQVNIFEESKVDHSTIKSNKDITIANSSVSQSKIAAQQQMTIEHSMINASTLHGHQVNVTQESLLESLSVNSDTAVAISNSSISKSAINAKKSVTMEYADVLSSEVQSDGPISIVKESKIDDSQINSNENIEIGNSVVSKSKVEAKQSVVVTEQSEIKESEVYAGNDVTIINESKVEVSLIKSGRDTVVSHSSLSKSQVDAKQHVTAEHAAITASVVHSNQMTVKNETTVADSQIKSDTSLLLEEVKLSNSVLTANTMDLHGNILCQGIGESAVKFEAVDTLTVHTSASVSGEQVGMKGCFVEQSGSIKMAVRYDLAATHLHNYGSINGGGKAHYNIQQLLINMPGASMHADDLSINAGVMGNVLSNISSNHLQINAGVFVNVAGHVAGYDQLTVNAGIAVNLGLMRSMQTKVVAGYAMNYGVYLPSPPSDPSKLYSWGNIFNVGKTLLYNVAPGMGGMVNTASSIYGVGSSGLSTKSKIYDIGSRLIKNPAAMNIGELVGVFASVADFAASASDCYGSISSSNNKNSEATITSNEDAPAVSESSSSWLQNLTPKAMCDGIQQGSALVGIAAWETVKPGISTTALYHDNSGGVLAGRIFDRSYDSSNRGVQLADSYTQFTHRASNSGYLMANKADVHITTTSRQNDGVMGSATRFNSGSMTVGDLQLNKGSFSAGGGIFATDTQKTSFSLTTKGEIAVRQGASALFSGAKINANTGLVAGTVNAKHSEFEIVQNFEIDKSGLACLTANSSLYAANTNNAGRLTAIQSHVEVTDYKAKSESKLHMDHASLRSKNGVQINGQAQLKHANITAATTAEFSANSNTKMTDSAITAKDTIISGDLDVNGVNLLQAEHRLDTTLESQITGKGAVLFKATEGTLEGAFTAKQAEVDIKILDHGVRDLLYGEGTYSSFKPEDLLSVNAENTSIIFDEDLHRSCKLGFVGADVTINGQLTMERGFHAKSIQGGIAINANIKSNDFMTFHAATSITNNEAQVTSDQKILLTTDNGNLDNIAGNFHAEKGLVADINGDVHNRAKIEPVHGNNSPQAYWKPAQLSGGQGEDGVAVLIHATGRVENHASIIQGQGDNIIVAKKGFSSQAKEKVYVAYHSQKAGRFRGHDIVENKTQVFGSNLVSIQGHNYIFVEEGGVQSEASSFVSKDGTDMYARDTINLTGKMTVDARITTSYSFFGLTNNKVKQVDKNYTSGLIYDVGQSYIHSHKGDVNVRDMCILGEGKLTTHAKNVHVSASIETHTLDAHQRSLHIDFFGLSAIQAVISGQDYVTPLLHLDPTVGKIMDAYQQSDTILGGVAGAWNAGLSLYNARQSLAQGEFLSRYGLGNSSGFNPNISLTYADTRTHSQHQTLGTAYIQRESWDVDAENEFTLDGIAVEISNDMHVKAQVFHQKGVMLDSSAESVSVGISVGGTVTGAGLQAGVNYSAEESLTKTQHMQSLKVGGTLLLDKVTDWKMEGAKTDVKDVKGSVKNFSVTSIQDEYSQDAHSLSASTAGNVGVSKSHHVGHHIIQQSGLIIQDGSNSDLNIENTVLDAGIIIAEQREQINFGTIDTRDQKNSALGYKLGFFANVKDLTPQQPNEDQNNHSMIPVATLSVDYHNHQSISHATIGTTIQPTILRDKKLSLHLDVPLACPKFFNTQTDNFQLPLEENVGHQEQHIEHSNVQENSIDENNSQSEHEVHEGSILMDASCSDTKVLDNTEVNNPTTLGLEKPNSETFCFSSEASSPEVEKLENIITQKIEEDKSLSEVAKNDLKERVTSAFLQAIKAGTEAQWEKVINSLGPQYDPTLRALLADPKTRVHGCMKGVLQGTGWVASFLFNFALAKVDGVEKESVCKEATFATATDFTYGSLINFAFETEAGPIGWVLTALSITDKLMYDKNYVDKLREEVSLFAYEAKRCKRNDSNKFFLEMEASHQAKRLLLEELRHEMAEIPNKMSDCLKFMWNKASTLQQTENKAKKELIRI